MAITITIEFECPRWLRRSVTVVGAPLLVLVTSTAVAADVSVPNTFASGEVVSASAMNANFRALEEGINSAVPAGTIVAHGGTGIPGGWLLCDGSIRDRSDYPHLYSAIGTSFGDGTGHGGSFNPPDLRGRFIRGATDGTPIGTFQTDSTRLPNSPFVTNATGTHRHPGTQVGQAIFDFPSGSNHMPVSGFATGDAGEHSHTIVSGGDSETRPKNVSIHFLIKY